MIISRKGSIHFTEMAKPRKKKSKKSSPKESPAKSVNLTKGVGEEISARLPVLKFWGGFAVLVTLFFVFTATPFYIKYIFKPVVTAFAWIGNGILRVLGQGTETIGEIITSPEFSINISKGCDGLAPIALLVAGILIYPSKWKYKWPGILVGTGLLILLNLIRIVSLYFVGRYIPNLFDLMHIEVWQAIFIIIAVALWLIWLNWVFKKEKLANAQDQEST